MSGLKEYRALAGHIVLELGPRVRQVRKGSHAKSLGVQLVSTRGGDPINAEDEQRGIRGYVAKSRLSEQRQQSPPPSSGAHIPSSKLVKVVPMSCTQDLGYRTWGGVDSGHGPSYGAARKYT
jgi:hypothetical protein